jgi:A/G-specific adenine glycosylase
VTRDQNSSNRMFGSDQVTVPALCRGAQHRLLEWYRAGHRALPWRATRDPYRILVSEIMLQQTQADRVVPKYHAFLEEFPTLASLAAAPASAVIRAWSGLGYNGRALNLQRACEEVVERYGGEVPHDPAVLTTLPGVGPYTAGAIACFAFGADVAFVDTNIRRVLHRAAAGPDVPEPLLTARQIDDLARRSVPEGEGYDWHQALMELGATICRARTAECERCPLQGECRARPVIQALLTQLPRRRTGSTERFEETSRYFRGRIVDALRAAPPSGLSLGELGLLLRSDFAATDSAWLEKHLQGLERDGLVVRVEPGAPAPSAINEEGPSYDAGPSNFRERFRLPD